MGGVAWGGTLDSHEYITRVWVTSHLGLVLLLSLKVAM